MMLFWKKTKTYKENIDYKLHPYSTDQLAVELLIEPYEQVFYTYGGVRFENQGEVGVLKFDYSIIHPGKLDISLLQDDSKLCIIMGEILSKLIIEDKANDGKTRTDNFEEFDLQ